jgi:pimeloyl-ACP methyl ester carboxylesterase
MSDASLLRTLPLPLCLLLACAHGGADRPPSVEEGFVTAQDGSQLWYQKRGSGSPVVLVPGAFMLQPDFDRLARGRTVVLYDPRNRARSSPVLDDTRISIQADVEDLEALRAHLGVERIIPVGWSYFGMMVALYAQAHPDRVERLVQLGPTSPVPGTKYPPPLSMPNETLAPDVKELYARVEDARATEAARDPAQFGGPTFVSFAACLSTTPAGGIASLTSAAGSASGPPTSTGTSSWSGRPSSRPPSPGTRRPEFGFRY